MIKLTPAGCKAIQVETRAQAGQATSEPDCVWQQLSDMFFAEWQESPELEYAGMIAWATKQWGALIPFATLLGKFNQQVSNGGLSQYHDNGYMDGLHKGKHVTMPLHQQLVTWAEAFGLAEALPTTGAEIMAILKAIRLMKYEGDDYTPDRWGIKNVEALDKRFPAIANTFEQEATAFFARIVEEEMQHVE